MSLFDPRTKGLKMTLDRDIVEAFEELCEKRGLEPEQMFRVMLAGFTRRKVYFNVGDELNFGKYNGLRLEEVIRADPRYVRWLLGESSWFQITASAECLLAAIEEGED